MMSILFSAIDTKHTIGTSAWGELDQRDIYYEEINGWNYEEINGWKHSVDLTPSFVTPISFPDKIQYEVKLLKAAETIFKAIGKPVMYLASPGNEHPICVKEYKKEKDVKDTDLVVLVAPRVDAK